MADQANTVPTKKDEAATKVAAEAGGAAVGAAAGAAMGSIAGPPGMAVGAVVGGIIGAAAVNAAESGTDAIARREKELDEEIGVTSKEDLGAPNLKHPPARVGAYSGGSAGSAGGDDAAPAEGPMPPPED